MGMRATPLAPREQAALDASFALDAARARDGQTNHSATALRRRALAATNGHNEGGAEALTGQAAPPHKEEV